jgi:hypothetical protein
LRLARNPTEAHDLGFLSMLNGVGCWKRRTASPADTTGCFCDDLPREENAVQDFIARHRSKIIGVLRGFDRIVFRGCLSRLLYPEGVAAFLNRQGCLLKDFGHFVQETTGALRDLATAAALRLGRPVHYLESSSVSKACLSLRSRVEGSSVNSLLRALPWSPW